MFVNSVCVASGLEALQRAHTKFAELLLDQVAVSLTEPSATQLAEELRALDLLKYCRSALERRKSEGRGPKTEDPK